MRPAGAPYLASLARRRSTQGSTSIATVGAGIAALSAAYMG